MAKRIFRYEGKELEDPDEKMSTDEVRRMYSEYFPEISNADTKTEKKGEDTVYTFVKRVGTKGLEIEGTQPILSGIREVQEGGKFIANWYLSHGYILLDIQMSTSNRKLSPFVEPGGQKFYVRKNPVYVLGRPIGVDPAPNPPPKNGDFKKEVLETADNET